MLLIIKSILKPTTQISENEVKKAPAQNFFTLKHVMK